MLLFSMPYALSGLSACRHDQWMWENPSAFIDYGMISLNNIDPYRSMISSSWVFPKVTREPKAKQGPLSSFGNLGCALEAVTFKARWAQSKFQDVLKAVQGHVIPVNLPCWPAISRHCHLLPRELAVSHAKKMWDAYGCVFSVSKLIYNSNVRGGSLVIAASFAFTIATQESSLMWIQPIKPIKSHSIGKYSVRSLEALPVTETSRVVCSLGKQKERAQLQRPQQLWAQLKRSQQNSCL